VPPGQFDTKRGSADFSHTLAGLMFVLRRGAAALT
jgi:hypothetical protein